MGYLKQALKVIEEKKNPHGDHSRGFSPNTFYEINEKNELIPGPKTTHQNLQGLFEKADSEVGAAYVLGTKPMIQGDFSDLAKEIQETEDRINLLWLHAREGTRDQEAFKGAVDRWKTLHLRAIRFYTFVEGKVN